jgi:hypothetical protein
MKNFPPFFVLVLIVVFSLMSCGKWSETGIWYRYPETHCSDPWATLEAEDDLPTETAVELYLMDLGIDFLAIDHTPIDPAFISCRACDCPNGRWVRVLAPPGSEAPLIGLGFFAE